MNARPVRALSGYLTWDKTAQIYFSNVIFATEPAQMLRHLV